MFSKRYWAGLALAVVAVFLAGAAGVAVASHQFSDVPDSSPYHDDIDWAVGSGIASGYANGTFEPRRKVSRQQLTRWFRNYYEAFGTVPGPQGPAGPAGPQGAQGAQGQQGPPGLGGNVYGLTAEVLVDPSAPASGTVILPRGAGCTVAGVGTSQCNGVFSAGTQVRMVASRNQGATGWVWGGDVADSCADDTQDCLVTIDRDTYVTITFLP